MQATRTQLLRSAFEDWIRSERALGRDPPLVDREAKWAGVVRANQEDRLRLLAAVEADHNLVTSIMARCSSANGWEGCVFFLDHFGHCWEPRQRKELPFVLFQFQIDELVKHAVEKILEPDTGISIEWIIEKCRDVGATWTLIAALAWAFIFVDNFTALVGAQDEDKVDDGGQNSTTDSLFGRMRFLFRRLPKWMWNPLTGEHDKTSSMQNPLNGALVMGAPTNANFGRHGRFKVILIDEAAWLGGTGDILRAAHDACSDTSRNVWMLSTPQGMNYFGDLRHGRIGQEDLDLNVVTLKVTTLHWHFHPFKDERWLRAERARRTPQNFAQNILISYTASVRGLVFFEYRHDVHVPAAPPVDFFPGFKLWTAYDPGRADAAAFLIAQQDPFSKRLYVIFYIERTQRVVDWFVPFFTGEIPDADHAGNPWTHTYSSRELDAIALVRSWVKIAGRPERNLGDNAGWQKTQNYWLSSYAVLSRYGISMYGVQHDSKREAVDKALLSMRFTQFAPRAVMERWGDRGAKTLGECFTNYRWPEERESGMMHPHQSPLHGPYSHGCDAYQILCSQITLPVVAVPLQNRDLGPSRPLNENFVLEDPAPERFRSLGGRGGRAYGGGRNRLY